MNLVVSVPPSLLIYFFLLVNHSPIPSFHLLPLAFTLLSLSLSLSPFYTLFLSSQFPPPSPLSSLLYFLPCPLSFTYSLSASSLLSPPLLSPLPILSLLPLSFFLSLSLLPLRSPSSSTPLSFFLSLSLVPLPLSSPSSSPSLFPLAGPLLEKLKEQIELCRTFANNKDESYAHITEEERDVLRNEGILRCSAYIFTSSLSSFLHLPLMYLFPHFFISLFFFFFS